MSGNEDSIKFFDELYTGIEDEEPVLGEGRTHTIIDRPNPLFDEAEDADDLQPEGLPAPALGEGAANPQDVFLRLKYEQPNVEVNTSARYATHEVIGERTVHQKVGSDPDNVTLTGVCTLNEANKVDVLEDFDYVSIVSHRWSGFAQVHSANTSPHTEGGSQDKDGDWLHTFTIEAVEVTDI